MKLLKSIIFISLLFILNGCLYLNTKVPLDTDVSVTKLGDKQGVSSVHSVLWLISWGDGGTAAAAKNGGITTINHLDSHVYMILFGLYSKVDTIAYGD
jgi:TRL-like protein family